VIKTELKQSSTNNVPNIEISEKEIEDFSNKLSIQQIEEYAIEYDLPIEKAKYDLAEYLLFNYKLNE
jgi:hypothetical protein